MGEIVPLSWLIPIMKIPWGILTCCCIGLFFSGVLCSPSSRDEGGSQPLLVSDRETSEPLSTLLFSPDAKNSYAVLPPLFKVLTGHSHQEGNDGAQRPQPDSRALSYMKRLYKMYATKEGIPKANKSHLYNTVRLFTPRAECKHPTEGQVKGRWDRFNLGFISPSLTFQVWGTSILPYAYYLLSKTSGIMMNASHVLFKSIKNRASYMYSVTFRRVTRHIHTRCYFKKATRGLQVTMYLSFSVWFKIWVLSSSHHYLALQSYILTLLTLSEATTMHSFHRLIPNILSKLHISIGACGEPVKHLKVGDTCP